MKLSLNNEIVEAFILEKKSSYLQRLWSVGNIKMEWRCTEGTESTCYLHKIWRTKSGGVHCHESRNRAGVVESRAVVEAQ